MAPVAGALLLRFLGAAAELLVVSTFWASVGWVVVETAMLVVGVRYKRDDVIAVIDNVTSAGCGSCIVCV